VTHPREYRPRFPRKMVGAVRFELGSRLPFGVRLESFRLAENPTICEPAVERGAAIGGGRRAWDGLNSSRTRG
jgi:hypothetical protein